MTDPELVLKKLARIETCVEELRRLGRPEMLGKDVREERFVEHTLLIAIQAAVDAGAHVVADERLGEPRSQGEVFELLRRAGWIEEHLADPLRRMCGFRNVLVHGYDEVDLAIVRDVVQNQLGDLLAFAEVVRARILAQGG